jgi:hypothetical protein
MPVFISPCMKTSSICMLVKFRLLACSENHCSFHLSSVDVSTNLCTITFKHTANKSPLDWLIKHFFIVYSPHSLHNVWTMMEWSIIYILQIIPKNALTKCDYCHTKSNSSSGLLMTSAMRVVHNTIDDLPVALVILLLLYLDIGNNFLVLRYVVINQCFIQSSVSHHK